MGRFSANQHLECSDQKVDKWANGTGRGHDKWVGLGGGGGKERREK